MHLPHARLTARDLALVAILALALVMAGCGSSAGHGSSSSSSTTTGSPASAPTASATTSGAVSPPAINELAAAEHPHSSQFPVAGGRSLRQLGALVKASAQLGAATGTFTPGVRRIAFGLNSTSGRFIYAPTALYISRNPGAPAHGPYLAPADPMTVAPADRSQQNSGPGGIKAIYAARVPIPRSGTFTLLALTRSAKGLIGSPGEIAVAASSAIPDVGQRPPAIATDTPATVGGNQALLTTRRPPERMQSVSLNQVLGKRPVALLFSTPQFCVSRVCGPVTDVAVALQHQFAKRITFIHQEVFADNQPNKGFRAQMKAFHLSTEPWLFVINRRGVIVARLEGAFGTSEVTQALKAALR
jgi:hypothetical protein